jgi:hypothetical protein
MTPLVSRRTARRRCAIVTQAGARIPMSNVSAVLLRRIAKAARHEPRSGNNSNY